LYRFLLLDQHLLRGILTYIPRHDICQKPLHLLNFFYFSSSTNLVFKNLIYPHIANQVVYRISHLKHILLFIFSPSVIQFTPIIKFQNCLIKLIFFLVIFSFSALFMTGILWHHSNIPKRSLKTLK
jgi:hypothetical protein